MPHRQLETRHVLIRSGPSEEADCPYRTRPEAESGPVRPLKKADNRVHRLMSPPNEFGGTGNEFRGVTEMGNRIPEYVLQ